MAQSTVSSLFDGSYKPHDYLNGVIEAINDYCLPYGQVKIANPETGVIIALILYIIAKEPTVNHKKLECYIILLNHMIKDATDSELFTWTLNRRTRIGNFNKFFECMEGKGLIRPKGRYNFVIRNSSSVRSILPQLEMILRNLLPYLSELLIKYENSTAEAMLKDIQKQDNDTNSYR